MAATIERQKELLAQLGGSIEVPGLSFDLVIDGMVENNPSYKAKLDALETKEQRAELKSQIINSLKTVGTDYINEQINTIKSTIQVVTEGVAQLTENVTTTIATALIPPAIGVPPVLPNPAYVLLENKTKKNTFLSLCNSLLQTFQRLLQAAVNIFFVLPEAVIALLETILTVKDTISAIPV